MKLKNLSCIVCINEDNAIGYQNKQLYNLKTDLKHFMNVTKTAKNCIVSLKTLQSIGKPLKHRFMYVVTHIPDSEHHIAKLAELGYDSTNCKLLTFAQMLEHINEHCDSNFICIGGSQIYNLFWQYASTLYITYVHDKNKTFDTSVPAINIESINSANYKVYDTQTFTETDTLLNETYNYTISTYKYNNNTH